MPTSPYAHLAGVECLRPDSYARSVQLDGQNGWLCVQPLSAQHALQLHYSASLQPSLPTLAARVRKMFDLDCQPQQISAHFAGDPLLGPTTRRAIRGCACRPPLIRSSRQCGLSSANRSPSRRR